MPQVHLTLPALLSPSLLKPSVPVVASAPAARQDFATLLGSFHADTPATLPAKVSKKETDTKKATEPKKQIASNLPASTTTKNADKKPELQIETELESQPQPRSPEKPEDEAAATPLNTITALILPSSQEALPIVFALPAPIPIQNTLEAAPAPATAEDSDPLMASAIEQAHTTLQTIRQAAPPFNFAPAAFTAPSFLPLAHAPSKSKALAALEADPLTTPQLPIQEAPSKAPPAPIAFEARLTPSQPKPDDALPNQPPPPPQTPVEQSKTPDTLPVQELKPDRQNDTVSAASLPHTPTPHAAEAPTVKAFEAATVTAPTPHLVKPATPERTPDLPTAPLTAASDLPETPALRTEPARDISFRIASTLTDAVDVKLTDRAGQIHVAVRSSDPVLTQSLQSNVTDLAAKLDKAGFQAETLIPNHTQPVQQPQQAAAFQQQQQDRRAPQQEFQQRKRRNAESAEIFTLNPQQEKQ